MMFSVVSPQTFCLMMLVVYGGFGATMFPLVNFFYGPDSIIAYFTETSEFETFFARAVGVLFLMVTPGPYVFGVPFEAVSGGVGLRTRLHRCCVQSLHCMLLALCSPGSVTDLRSHAISSLRASHRRASSTSYGTCSRSSYSSTPPSTSRRAGRA